MTTVGDMISFSTPIDETKHGNSYFEFPELLWDFQMSCVTHQKNSIKYKMIVLKIVNSLCNHLYKHTYHHESNACLGVEIRLQIKKL